MSTIKLRQIEEDPSRKDVFGVLNEYIQPETATSASQAATSFTQTVKSPDEEFFWGFWDNIFDIAGQIPHDNPAQDKLVAFVRELTLVPETGDKVWDARVWIDLPLFGAAAREHLDRVAGTDAQVSFHAFVARLLHAGISPGSETTAIWMLRDALEQEAHSAGNKDANHDDLMAAAVYIEYAGATLVQKLALQPEPELDDADQRVLKGGKLWEGKSGLTVDRWRFWGQRFGEQAKNATSEQAKNLALHAAKLIEFWTQTRLSA
ncbi:hypothetical protein NUW58_g3846 [Xylaria curta]|uniref:Uncharacterized protein n=1 Tax=Xylaria curta TaxID=42375 RepID=A0ACC1P9I2_9PEZI|nr:hypothetical protein NUW58_g3846 [Xylaria curta]